VTPFEKAEQLLKDLQSACPSCPALAYARTGDQVGSCESLIVAVTGATHGRKTPKI
jgi:hypothetical protein